MAEQEYVVESGVGVWRDPQFILFWSARVSAMLGASVTTVALPVLVFQLTGSAAYTGLLAVGQFLPYLIFGLVAGAVADRARRRLLMAGSDLANGLIFASIIAVATVGHVSAAQVITAGLLSSTAFVWFDAANFGAVPSLVGRDRVIQAMSVLTGTSNIIGIAGPALGGILITTLGVIGSVGVIAVAYVVSASILLTVGRPLDDQSSARPPISPRQLGADIAEGLRFIRHHRVLRSLTLVAGALSVTGGAVLGFAIVYAVQALGVPAESGRIGLLSTVGAVGGFAVTLVLPLIARRIDPGRIALGGLTANVAALVALVAAPGFVVGLLAYFAYEATYGLVVLNGITTRQTLAPAQLVSRVNTVGRLLGTVGRPLGAAVGAALATRLPIRDVFLVVSVIAAVFTTLAWLSPLRTMGGATQKPRAVPGQESAQ